MNTQVEYFDNEEYLCIADYHTHKKIAIHELNNPDSVLFVDLNEITNLGEKILAYEVQSLDTIMVLTTYSNNLYFINRNGEIWKQVDFNPYLEEEGGFELFKCETPFQFNDSTLIFSLEYLVQNLPANSRGDLDVFYQKYYEAPTLFKVDNIYADTLSCAFGLPGLYTNFSANKSVPLEAKKFTFFEDKIIFNSSYSDSLYIINPNSFEIERKIAIHSDYSELLIQPITTNDLQTKPELLNENFKSNGKIRTVLYDKIHGFYSVLAMHKPSGEHFPWSIIKLDSTFNKVDEIKMDESKYLSLARSVNNGILISNYYETLNDTDHFEKNTFTLFQYE